MRNSFYNAWDTARWSGKSDDGDYRSAFQIDCLVYDLYGLTEVEIALVEGA